MKQHIHPLMALTLMPMLFSCQSCSHRTYPEKNTDTQTTTLVRETIRDTIITVQSDTSILQALIECDANGQAYLQQIEQLTLGSKIRQSLQIQDNRITATAAIDSMSIYLTYKDRYQETTKTAHTVQVIRETTNILDSWQKFLITVGFFSILALCLWLCVKFSTTKD